MIRAHVVLDITDIDILVRKWAETQGIDATGFTVNSWTYEVMRAEGDMLVEPVRHHLDPSRKTIES